MWELDHKESWAPKNWCFWTVLLEKTLESPMDWEEIQPVNPKGNQSWIFIGRTDAEVETPVLWPPYVKNWLIWKDPDAGKDWRSKEKGMTEDEMAGWHHWLYGHESEWTPGVGDGQGGLACCDSWGHKESDTTEWLNWTYQKVNKGKLRIFITLLKNPFWLNWSRSKSCTLKKNIFIFWKIVTWIIKYLLQNYKRKHGFCNLKTFSQFIQLFCQWSCWYYS